MRLFADDCLVYRITNSPNDCLKLQDLSLLCDWESEWQMEFNKSKFYVIHMSRKKHSIGTLYYLQDTPLEISTKQSYLGVDLSTDVNWSHPINSIRPQLEQCSPIWDPYEKGDILSLEKVQRRTARFVSGDVLAWRVKRNEYD